MDEILVFMLIGFFSGLHSACWGSYKDSIFEDFCIFKFIRSILIGLFLAIISFPFFKDNTHINLGVFFAFIVSLERISTEFYKAFIRKEDQSIYRIPSSFHVMGKVATNQFQRLTICLVLILSLIGSFFIINSFPMNKYNILTGSMWGLLGGLMTASGGAWKDAPIEGFNIKSYFRSPTVSCLLGAVFSVLLIPYSVVLFASIGAERMSVELYKAFIAKLTPGKFKQTIPIFPDWIRKRRVILIPYIITWIFFVILLVTPVQMHIH